MKQYLLIMTLLLPMFIFAQNNSEQWEDLYRQEVKNSMRLEDMVNLLRADSIQHTTSIYQLKQDTAQLAQSLQQTNDELSIHKQELNKIKTQLDQCRKDSAYMQKQLSKCKQEHIKHIEDSIKILNGKIASLNDKISTLKDDSVSTKHIIQEKEEGIQKLDSIISYFDQQIAKKSVDELYKKSDSNELKMCITIYDMLGKTIPNNIKLTLKCFEAEKLTCKKYDKNTINNTIASISQGNTKIGQTIVAKLNAYKNINDDAIKLWLDIQNNVCSAEIPNDDFTQIQSKRQIWQRTQRFLNKYPNLAADYPYVFNQLQDMLRKIWNNANNFNKITNPFE